MDDMNNTKNIKDVDSGTCSCKTIRVTEGEYTIEICDKDKVTNNNNKN